MDSELTKVKEQVKDTAKDIIRVEDILMPAMYERIEDRLDEIHRHSERPTGEIGKKCT